MGSKPRFRFINRPVIIILRLLPLILSFLRDYHCYFAIGSPVPRSAKFHQNRAEKLTRVLGDLGTGFVKAAQVLSTRDDILLPVYTRTLRRLQDDVPAFPTKFAHRIIQEETGKKTRELFDSFESKPIAAASLGQVYQATYKGKKVAVKVLRPDVERIIEIDIAVLNIIITVFEILVNNHFVRSFRSVFAEYARIMRQEVNFRNEQKNSDRLRENFRTNSNIVVPRCFRELTHQRLVVFEFVEGCRVDDVAGLSERGLTPQDMLERMITTYVRMTIVHGFVHADPHPGNLLVDNKGRLVILDYGMAVEFDDETRRSILRGCLAIVRDDINTLVDCFYQLGMVDESANRALIRDAAKRLLTIQMRDDFEPRMVQEIADEILSTFHEFPVRMPQQLVYLFRASALVEGLGMGFDGNFSAVREATPIVKKMIREIALEPDKALTDRAKDGFNVVYNFVDQLQRVVERLEREEQRLRINAADMTRIEKVQVSIARRIILALFALFLGVCGIASAMLFDNIIYSLLTIAGTICITTFLILVSIFLPIRR